MNPTNSGNTVPLRAAYGLNLTFDLPGAPSLETRLVEAQPEWPAWSVRWQPTSPTEADHGSITETWSEVRATIKARPQGRVTIDRDQSCTTLHLTDAPTAEALVHPLLASTGVVANHWLGRASFHAGAFAVDGTAWGVLGGRGMGKTSLLMALHRAGMPIVADDLVVLDGDSTFAGPRCLDLRESAFERFGEGEPLGQVGNRERWRVTLPPVPGRFRFGGWVLAAWADEVSLDPAPTALRLAALASNRALLAKNASSAGVMDGLAFPMVVLARPQDWRQADEATDRLVEHLARASDSINGTSL